MPNRIATILVDGSPPTANVDKPDLRAYMAAREVASIDDDFGAVGDGVADDTGAFTAANTALSHGAELLLGENKIYKISSIPFTKRIHLMGRSWYTNTNGVFGEAAWLTMANHGGTIILCTATTGVGVELSVPGTSPNGLLMSNLLIIGPGSGTSTGLKLGHANGEGASSPIITNVGIANFALGFHGEFCNNGSVETYIRGCSTGRKWTNDSNNNRIFGEVQWSTVDAELFDNSKGNTLDTVLYQNCTNKGVRTANNSYNIDLINCWLENSGAITDVVDFASGPSCGIYGGQVSKGNIKFATANGRMDGVQITGTAGIELTSGATGAVIIASKPQGSGTLTNNSPSATIIDDNGLVSSPLFTNSVHLSASADDAARIQAEDSTPVTTSPVTIFSLPVLSGAAEAAIVLVSGTKSGSSTIYFSDVLHIQVGATPSVLNAKDTSAPATRTFTMSSNNLQLAMSADTYSVTAVVLAGRGD